MFKSIFTKYIVTFMLIIVVSFVMLATIISTMMVNYYSDNSGEQLSAAADAAEYLIETQLSEYSGETLESYIRSNPDEIGSYFSAFTKYNRDIFLFVTDGGGKILASFGFHDSAFGGDTVPQEVMDAVQKGGYRDGGDIGGLLNVKHAVRAKPVKNGDAVIGAVFACSASESMGILMRTTVRAVVMTCLWVLLAALIAVYFITDKIIGPLKDMGRAAKSFASGKFDVRVPVTGRDEIAELAVAFNNMASSLSDLENMRSTFLSNSGRR